MIRTIALTVALALVQTTAHAEAANPTMPAQLIGSWCEFDINTGFYSYKRLDPNKGCPTPGGITGEALIVTKDGVSNKCPSIYSVIPSHNESDDYTIHFDCVDEHGGHYDMQTLWRILRDGTLKVKWD